MRVTFLLFMVFLSVNCNSGLYQCKNKLGEIEFKDVPCSLEEAQKALIQSIDDRGLLRKYFKAPGFNSINPKCIGKTCYCGSEDYEMKRSSVRQLQDSAGELFSLHRSYKRVLKSYNYSKSKGYPKDSSELKEKSCLLRVHQKLFNKNYSLYEKLIEKTLISQSKITGEAINCGEKPKLEHSFNQYEYNKKLGVWGNCKDKESSNWAYKSTTRDYNNNKSSLDRIERALRKLKSGN